jgi:hypothetical protein
MSRKPNPLLKEFLEDSLTLPESGGVGAHLVPNR